YAAVLVAAISAIRFAWVFGASTAVRLLLRNRARSSWKSNLVISWAGLRGALSLVAALAIPLTTSAGRLFPQRGMIVATSFYVILESLLLQGLTLPWLIRRLGFARETAVEQEEAGARLAAALAALKALERSAGRAQTPPGGKLPKKARSDQEEHPEERASEGAEEAEEMEELVEDLHRHYMARAERFRGRLQRPTHKRPERQQFRALRKDLLDAEKATVLRLRDQGKISDDTLRIIQHDLDLEQLRYEAHEDKEEVV
ncbi:MAG TPA: cation:proton antiporter, partial [Chthonomonadales bacterium]|nr:cation:proton antiporter [Chthonomonadales bacterium]